MRYKFGPNTASLHYFSSFRRENIYTIPSSFSLSFSYAFIHAFQVSKQWRVMPFSVLSSPRHGTHVAALLILFHFITDGRLDIRKGPCGYKKPIFHIIRYSGEPGWSPTGGHPFCEDTDESAYADCCNGCPQRMDIEQIVQSVPQA